MSERIRALKGKRAQRFEAGEPNPEASGAGLAARICRESVQVLQDEKKLLPLKKNGSIGVIFPRFSRLDAKIMIERDVLQEREFVRKEFGKFGLAPEVRIVAIEPTAAEIEEAVTWPGTPS